MSVIPTFWSLSWRNPHPNFWGHSCFANRNKFGASTILTSVCSETAPLVRVQESFRCHLKRWGIQLSEYRSVSFLVLDSVSQEHNSFLLLFGVLSKFGIHQVTLVIKVSTWMFSNSSSLDGRLRTWIWLSSHPVLEEFLNLFRSRSSAVLSSGV